MLPWTPRQTLAILDREIKKSQGFSQIPHCPALPARSIAIGLPRLNVPQRRPNCHARFPEPVRADAWHVRRLTPCQILPVAHASLLEIVDRRVDPPQRTPLVFHNARIARRVQQVPGQPRVGERAPVIRMAAGRQRQAVSKQQSTPRWFDSEITYDGQYMTVVLASQSPRRRELLTLAGIPFVVRVAGVREVHRAGELASEYVKRLAVEKARAIEQSPGEIVLAADTTVVLGTDNETVLEKPADAEDARRMMALLSGRSHRVLTGICLKGTSVEVVDLAMTRVRFSALSEKEIEDYVASGEPMDKAGGYAIQGLAAKFVESIDGCYFNVMGLPLSLVYRHLKRF